MRNNMHLLARLAVGVLVLAGAGCSSGGGGGGGGGGDTNDNAANVNDNAGNDNIANDNVADDNGNENVSDDNANDNVGPALIKTHILMDANTMVMRPKAGDDLIVWGDEEMVYYIVPSEIVGTETAGTEVPEGARFAWTHFAVAGKKIALVTELGEVRVLDTATGESRDFAATDVLVSNPRLTDDTLPGLTQVSGDLFATLNDTDHVADGNAVKVIDVAGADPDAWEVISFALPEAEAVDLEQVAVDAQSRRVAATDMYDRLWIWDVDDPAAEPQMIDMGLSSELCCINDAVQIRFEGDSILYQQDPEDMPLGLGSTNVALLNIASATVTVLSNNPTQISTPVVLRGGSLGYVQYREDLDVQTSGGTSYRTAIGQVDDAPASTLASQSDTYALRPTELDLGIFPQEQCYGDELKKVGYGSSMCVTPDGSRWFLAGWGPIDSTFDYLQMSMGGAFEDFADPEGTTSGSVMATDVSCSDNVAAFRVLRETSDSDCLTNEEWVVGFILLDRLEE